MKCWPVMCGVLALASAIGCADNATTSSGPGDTGGTTGGEQTGGGTTGGAMNNTGYTVGQAVDTDGNGTADGIVVDENGDGVPDGVDTNMDGKVDKPLPPRPMDEDDAGPPPLPMPKADKPCGTDINFDGGEVRPSIGSIAKQSTGADPTKAGKYKVVEKAVKVPIAATKLSAAGYDISVEAGELSGTLWLPSDDGQAASAEGPFPVLLGGAGFQATYSDYQGYWTQFASHGIAVLGLTTRGSNTEALHDQEALENSLAITWLTSTSEFKASIDATKVAMAGHSKGGKVAFFTAAIDPRIDLVFGWDPSNAGGPPCGIADAMGCQALPVAPNCGAEEGKVKQPEGVLHYMHAETFVFGVPADPLVNPGEEHNAINFYRGAPSPANLVYFDGGHAAWVESGVAGLIGDKDIIRVTKAVQTAKLLSVFYGAEDLAKYLPGGEYLKGEGKVTMNVSK